VIALADFFDSLLHGLLLVSLALTLGGVAWGLWGLRAWQHGAPQFPVRRCLALLGFGALVLALCQVAVFTLRIQVLSAALGTRAMGDFLATAHFAAGAARTLLALGVAAAAWWLARKPARPARWTTLTVLAGLLAASGGWLTHAAGRLDGRALLIGLTVLHQVGAAVWVGALVQLASTWQMARRDSLVESAWPELVARFSKLALVSVLALVASAVPLAWIYAGNVGNLMGTAYGSLIVIKSMMLGAALLLAAFNFTAAQSHGRRPQPSSLRSRVPYLVEAEIMVAVMILFAAAALSDQPPSADLRAADRATVREVAEVFRPKVPSLRTPSLETMRQERSRAPGGERSPEAYLWSNFSHNVSGLILLLMGLVALAGALRQAAWERYWSLGFVAMAAFVYLRAAANDGVWPFGPASPAALDAESMQHFLAAFLVLALGLFEWRARSAGLRLTLWGCVFPALAMAGGVLVLTHSHTAFEPKPYFLVQVTHTSIGALAGLMAAARWLELRLPPPAARVAGVVAAGAMVAIALVLVFYREANVVIPA
jgi:copper resistance protein D